MNKASEKGQVKSEKGHDLKGNPMTPLPGGMTMLPAKAGTCPDCATVHEPGQPHNQQSLFYQMRFHGLNGRWPTWEDAMRHCSPEVRAMWIEGLAEHGVIVDPAAFSDPQQPEVLPL
jgi:hypothetical protein